MITAEEVEAAQKSWGQSIIEVGKLYKKNENYQEKAIGLLRELYAFDLGAVAFKPTLAADEQFRNNTEAALSYFIGDNPKYPEDQGFAIKGWVDVKFENNTIICLEDSALAMGNYFFTNENEETIKVEYSFAYLKAPSESIQICLHHSSLPFNPSSE